MGIRIICLPKKEELEMFNKLNNLFRVDEIKA
jgi:hypothetical protein